MSDNDNEDQPKTVFLKKPPAAAPAGKPPENGLSPGKLICLDTVPQDVRPDNDEYWLTRSEEIIGRGPDNTVQIRSPEISREHARFVSVSGRWAIEDRGSRNGVWVNGTRVTGRTELFSGDIINLGRIPFRFEVLGAAPADVIPRPAQGGYESSADSPSTYAETIAREPEGLARDMDSAAGGDKTDFGRAASTPDQDTEAENVRAPENRADTVQDGAEVPDFTSSTAALRKHLPEILASLVEQARKGDAAAARVCLDYLIHEQQRLPLRLERTGTISGHVKTIVSAMMDHKITPKQALNVLQVLETAGELLKKRKGG